MDVKDFSQIAQLYPEPSFLVDAEGAIRAANAAALALANLDAQSVGSLRLQDFASCSPDTLDHYLLACARSSVALPGALSIRTRDGASRLVRCEGTVWPGPKGHDGPLILVRCDTETSTKVEYA